MRAGIILIIAIIGVIAISPCLAEKMANNLLKPVDLPRPLNKECHGSFDTFELSTMSAGLVADRTQGDAPFTTNFYDISYGTPEIWEWDFGDGNTSDEQNPTHTYTIPGIYDVALTVSKRYQYETPMYDNMSESDFNRTGKGQFTDIGWKSTERKTAYITVNKTGSGKDQTVPDDWYPEPKKAIQMPSGRYGTSGTGELKANTITITPDTQKGYTEQLTATGVYWIDMTIPYNTEF